MVSPTAVTKVKDQGSRSERKFLNLFYAWICCRGFAKLCTSVLPLDAAADSPDASSLARVRAGL